MMSKMESDNGNSGKELLLQKCINRLECMRNPLRDERPKSERKLRNVLQKEASVCYVSSILNIIFKDVKYAEITIIEKVEVRKTDKQLDEEIAAFVLKEAERQGRKLLVLPCDDSNLHITASSSIEEWYAEKTRRFNKENPIEGIARASCYTHNLDAQEVVEELKRHGYISVNVNHVTYKFPEVSVQLEIENALQKFQNRIQKDLDSLSARGHEFFSWEVIEANKNIQSSRAEAIRRYCESHYSRKYNLYVKTESGNNNITDVIQQFKGASVDNHDDMVVDPTPDIQDVDSMDTMPTSQVELIPVTLTAETSHVLVQLFKTHIKPETLSDLETFIQDTCGVMYVISPKYILSNIIKEGREIPPNFQFNILLGEIVQPKLLRLGNLTDLAKTLSFPGKDKIDQRSPARKLYQRPRYEPMDTSSHDTRTDTFQAFQRHVYDVVKVKAERHRAVAVMMDREAELRCQQRVFNWVKECNSNPEKRLTKDTFTKELVELGFEFTNISTDYLIKLLSDCGYLEIKAPDGAVVYNLRYKKPNASMLTSNTGRFLQYWEDDYKPNDNINPAPFATDDAWSSRKRHASGPSQTAIKKMKVIDI